MSELLRLQMAFTRAVPELIETAQSLGLFVVLGECSRSDEQSEINALGQRGRIELVQYLEADGLNSWSRLATAIANNKGSGIRRSLHMLGLAVDLKLFAGLGERDLAGEYPSYRYLTQTDDYAPLGRWWETYHPLARWGGRFGDGGHFSFEYRGIK